MILQRYIFREILISFLGTLFVLLLIIVGNNFVRLLGYVSSGTYPVDALGKLLLLGSVNGAIKLVPVALLIGMMLAFGRLYRDHEMAAFHASGVGPKQFYKGILLFVAPLTLFMAVMILFVIPQIQQSYDNVTDEIKQRPEASGIPVGEFMYTNAGNKAVTLFVEDIDEENVVMRRFFMHLEEKKKMQNKVVRKKVETILTAEKALLYIDPESGARIFKIKQGSRYDHDLLSEEFSIFKFAEHGIHIPALILNTQKNHETETFVTLLNNKDLGSKAEIHWRLALIISAPVMAFLAFPLSYTTPRQGRFGKLTLGILLYSIYASLIVSGQSMIEDGKIPNWLGLWWIHLLFILVALYLLKRQYKTS